MTDDRKFREFDLYLSDDGCGHICENSVPWVENVSDWAKPDVHVIEYKAYSKLKAEAQKLAEALEKAQSIIVEDECEECGTFTCVRYEVKPVIEALVRWKAFNGEGS